MERRKRPRAPLINRKRAKAMRHDPVALEKFFWSHLRNRQLGGFKFRRQLPIGPYIADFVCAERMLIVELDGPFHAQRQSYDATRDAFLEEMGYRVWRFSNSDAADDWVSVLQSIKHELTASSPQPSPPIGGEGVLCNFREDAP
ncbi:MAG: endonuclease domain-containing protein [Proteobacteria bacterium]|nr:endonuclease domain-containing protein [Pseudomonadota bacterium]